MDNIGTKFTRFDQVRIVTARNVTYLSATPGSVTSPKGIWQVAGAINDDLLLVKGNATIKIPAADVLKVVEYNINHVTDQLKKLLDNGQTKQEPGPTKQSEANNVGRTPERH